jgi:hypothetical protein
MQIETVKIAAPDVPGGHVVINKEDFKEGEMTLWQEQKEEVKADDQKKKKGTD